MSTQGKKYLKIFSLLLSFLFYFGAIIISYSARGMSLFSSNTIYASTVYLVAIFVGIIFLRFNNIILKSVMFVLAVIFSLILVLEPMLQCITGCPEYSSTLMIFLSLTSVLYIAPYVWEIFERVFKTKK